MPQINKEIKKELDKNNINIIHENIDLLCDRISQGKTTAPISLIELALYEVDVYLSYINKNLEINIGENCEQDRVRLEKLNNNFKQYYEKLKNGEVEIVIEREEDEDNNLNYPVYRHRKDKTYCSLKVQDLTTNFLTVKRDAKICGNLTVCGTINNSNLTSLCGPGPLNVGTSDATPLNLVTDGCTTTRLSIDPNGAVSIAEPTSGIGLTVTGNTGASAIKSIGHGTTTAPALTLIDNPPASASDFVLTINAAGVVTESTVTVTGSIMNGCQPGPLNIGTSDATSLNLSTNGCVTRLSIDANGATNIAAPTSEVGLTVTGNAGASAIEGIGNGTTTAPALKLLNNPAGSNTDFFLTINNAGVVTESLLTPTNFLSNGCQAGPITIGTSDATSVNLSTNGCVTRLSIDAKWCDKYSGTNFWSGINSNRKCWSKCDRGHRKRHNNSPGIKVT